MGRIPFRKLSPRSSRLHKFGMHVEGMFLYLFRLLVHPMPPQHASASWRMLVREIRSGRSVGLLPDQRVDSGEPVPFSGCDAPTSTSPACLALKLNWSLIAVHTGRTGNARSRVVFHRPILTSGRSDEQTDPLQVTEDLNHLFESCICKRPDQWLYMKRRWLKGAYNMSPGHNSPCA